MLWRVRHHRHLYERIGAIAAVVALLLRRTLHETQTAEARANKEAGGSLIFDTFTTYISGIVKAEMFPPEVRALGVGLAYAVPNAIFGGSAEYVALGLKSLGHESAFYCYVTVVMVIAFLVSLRLPRQASYLQHDH